MHFNMHHIHTTLVPFHSMISSSHFESFPSIPSFVSLLSLYFCIPGTFLSVLLYDVCMECIVHVQSNNDHPEWTSPHPPPWCEHTTHPVGQVACHPPHATHIAHLAPSLPIAIDTRCCAECGQPLPVPHIINVASNAWCVACILYSIACIGTNSPSLCWLYVSVTWCLVHAHFLSCTAAPFIISHQSFLPWLPSIHLCLYLMLPAICNLTFLLFLPMLTYLFHLLHHWLHLRCSCPSCRSS